MARCLMVDPEVARCRLGAAAGIETYFDTTTSLYRTHYEDRHGVGARTLLSAQCFPIRSLALEVQAGRSFDIASYDASVVMFGLELHACDARGLLSGPRRQSDTSSSWPATSSSTHSAPSCSADAANG